MDLLAGTAATSPFDASGFVSACPLVVPRSDVGGFGTPIARAPRGPTVSSALRRYGPAYLERYPDRVTDRQRRVLTELMNCRQPALGAHEWHCKWCGHTHLSYNVCNNRHCPSCGGKRRWDWLQKMLAWSLPSGYMHLVFAPPHELIPLWQTNPAVLYRLLFRAVGQTLLKFCAREHGLRPGLVLMLHTWGQEGELHLHIHVLCTAGGLSLDGQTWIRLDAKSLDSQLLMIRFREEFLRGLKRLLRRQELVFPAALNWIREEEDLEEWMAPMRRKRWHLDCQDPPPDVPRDSSAAVKYLARYMAGSAIHDGRMLSDDGQHVVIRIKNYRTGGEETRRLTGEEFIRRYLLHVLPPRMQRVRYMGLYSAALRKEKLPLCRKLLEQQAEATLGEGELLPPLEADDDELPEAVKSAPACPRCLMPEMKDCGRLDALRTYIRLRWLQEFADAVSMLLFVLPFVSDAPRREPSVLEETGECVLFTVITTLDVDVNKHTQTSPPDT